MAAKTKTNGDCYKASAEALLEHSKVLGDDCKLAHGTCTITEGHLKGKAFGHAWLELGDDLVVDCANGRENLVRKSVYYQAGKCRRIKRYTREEAAAAMLKHGHFGPWHKTKALHS